MANLAAEAATPVVRVALLPAIQGGDQLADRLRAAMPDPFSLDVVHYPPDVHSARTYEWD